jgi:hypothetical protein
VLARHEAVFVRARDEVVASHVVLRSALPVAGTPAVDRAGVVDIGEYTDYIMVL